MKKELYSVLAKERGIEAFHTIGVYDRLGDAKHAAIEFAKLNGGNEAHILTSIGSYTGVVNVKSLMYTTTPTIKIKKKKGKK